MKSFYKEEISRELEQEIVAFLEENKSPTIAYWEWRRALQLHNRAYEEIIESVKEFGDEFDSIMMDFKKHHHSSDKNYANPCLIESVNLKLNALYRKYIRNERIRSLLVALSSKKYF